MHWTSAWNAMEPGPTTARGGHSSYYVDDHQQYLAKNPWGYRCHAATGIPFPSE